MKVHDVYGCGNGKPPCWLAIGANYYSLKLDKQSIILPNVKPFLIGVNIGQGKWKRHIRVWLFYDEFTFVVGVTTGINKGVKIQSLGQLVYG